MNDLRRLPFDMACRCAAVANQYTTVQNSTGNGLTQRFLLLQQKARRRRRMIKTVGVFVYAEWQDVHLLGIRDSGGNRIAGLLYIYDGVGRSVVYSQRPLNAG